MSLQIGKLSEFFFGVLLCSFNQVNTLSVIVASFIFNHSMKPRKIFIRKKLLWLWFEKNYFIKSTFSCDWFGKVCVWLKLWLKLRLNKK
jgi:hypothetical protein